MDKIIIEGGSKGQTKLKGVVEVGGAKNAALPILMSAILSEGVSQFKRVPKLQDIITLRLLLEGLGLKIVESNDVLQMDGSSLNSFEAPYEQVRKMRASVLVLGPLLARMGKAKVSLRVMIY
jgi:UDP-N-acetylglucosamine 1-carboxyvinyltransferase